MNREAVALGVPVYTTFAGELGAVDEMLVREGRLARPRPRPTSSSSRSGPSDGHADDRDPALLLDLMLSALER